MLIELQRMNKHILILALETLLEQLECSDTDTDNLTKQGYVHEELNRLQFRVKSKDFARWLQYTLDLEAENMFGEFGFATLNEEEQRRVFEKIHSKDLIN